MQHYHEFDASDFYVRKTEADERCFFWTSVGIGTGFVAGSAFWLMVARIWGVL